MIKLAYLFTSFPVLTETPSQRELRIMRELPVDLDVYSLWGGDRKHEGLNVHTYSKWRLSTVPWWLAYWTVRKPLVVGRTLARLLRRLPPNWKNFGETLLGLGFALTESHRLASADSRPDVLHAVWATMPATAAQLISALTRIPFSMGAHAYDVFEGGGDWLLDSKLREAACVISSTGATQAALLARGASPNHTVLIRRGFDVPPPFGVLRRGRDPLRVLSVGRLVEKKGYLEQLDIYAALKARDVRFEARIIGDGPLRTRLERRISHLGLDEQVQLLGALEYREVIDQYGWADVLVFTGKVASSGDRDGLPNVVPEAMAAGVPVIGSVVSGVPEAIENGRRGLLVPLDASQAWVDALLRVRDDDALCERIRAQARQWVDTQFDAGRNTRSIYHCLRSVSGKAAEPAVHGEVGCRGAD